MEESFDIIVFGSCIVDFISYVPRIPKIGETIHGTRFETGYGGKGANQVVAAAKLGSKTAICGKLGDDSWGRDYLENLNKENVSTKYIEILNGEKTGIAQINVAYNGDNQIVIVVGANNSLGPKDVRAAKEIFDNSKVLLCQFETPIPGTIEALQQFKGISILNAAPGLSKSSIPKELFTLPTIFCVNESEASLITENEVQTSHEISEAIKKLISFGCNIVILTLGERGAAFATKDDQRPALVRAPKIDMVVDTTGAGDAFLGALGHFHANYPNIPLYKKIGASCEIASISVQFPGTQKSFPRYKNLNFNELLKKKYEWNYLEVCDRE